MNTDSSEVKGTQQDVSKLCNDTNDKLSIATYNILFPVNHQIKRYLTDHKTRYEHIINHLIPEVNSDIVLLHECTTDFVSMLYNNNYITKNYQISNIADNKRINSIILSKFSFKELLNNRTKVYALLEFNGANIIVIAAHLGAREDNAHIRAGELKQISSVFEHLPSYATTATDKAKIISAINNKNIIMGGDLNLHLPGENLILDEHKWIDVWLDHHSHLDGITWDPYNNRMISFMLPFDNRRMRLDRVLIQESQQLKSSTISIFGNKRIGNCYLYPSDHFGLKATFTLGRTQVKTNAFKEEFYALPSQKTGYRSIKTIMKYRKIAITSLGLPLLWLLLWTLFLIAML